VLLNGLAWQPGRGGVSTYIEELTAALPGCVRDASLLQLRIERPVPRNHPPGAISVVGWRRSNAVGRVLGSHMGTRSAVFHGLDAALPFARRGPSVITVHDVSVFDHPAGPRRRLAAKRAALSHACRAADTVISVSRFTAERVAERWGRDATVIPLAPRPSFRPAPRDEILALRAKWRLPRDFVLGIGTADGRKAPEALSRAARALDVPAVTVGPTLFDEHPSRGMRHLGFVPLEDLRCLYSAAAATVYLSEYEGFGLPPFESLACGTPVVSSRVGAVADHLADAVTFVDGLGTDELAQALTRVLELDARPDRPTLSWEHTAKATADVYRELGAQI